MMRTILVPFAPGLASESALDAALSLAKSMNSHIRSAGPNGCAREYSQ